MSFSTKIDKGWDILALKSFLNAEFLDSGVCSCPKPYLSLIRMENIFLGFFGHFFHDEVSVINYEKSSIS